MTNVYYALLNITIKIYAYVLKHAFLNANIKYAGL